MKLSVHPVAFADVRDLLGRAERFAPGGLESVEEWCAGAACFAVENAGRIVGAYALEVLRHAHGNEGVIVAAGGQLPGVSLAASVLPDAEARMVGCDVVRVQTMRPGLVKLMTARGYQPVAVVLQKRLKPWN